jgi:hypothetical protein
VVRADGSRRIDHVGYECRCANRDDRTGQVSEHPSSCRTSRAGPRSRSGADEDLECLNRPTAKKSSSNSPMCPARHMRPALGGARRLPAALLRAEALRRTFGAKRNFGGQKAAPFLPFSTELPTLIPGLASCDADSAPSAPWHPSVNQVPPGASVEPATASSSAEAGARGVD